MVVIDNSKYDEAIKSVGDAKSARIPWNLQMFRNAEGIIAEHGFAIAIDDAGTDIAVLCWEPTSYIHDYTYTGEIDTEFLDNYDCLFLHGCNEFSVELCRTALDKGKGHTLVMVGEDWQYAVDDLPDIEGKNCIILDDMIDTAGTITNAANAIKAMGALNVYAGATHPVLSGPAISRIQDSAICELALLNTIPMPESKKLEKMTFLSVAPLFAEAMTRVYTNGSISKLFDVNRAF